MPLKKAIVVQWLIVLVALFINKKKTRNTSEESKSYSEKSIITTLTNTAVYYNKLNDQLGVADR